MECHVNEQTDEKKMFYNEVHCQSGDIEDSVCGVISVPVVKINKMADGGAPRLGANEVGFLTFEVRMRGDQLFFSKQRAKSFHLNQIS